MSEIHSYSFYQNEKLQYSDIKTDIGYNVGLRLFRSKRGKSEKIISTAK